ncbi:MAG: eukaryotic-like serine/threonine-protein kinase [Acidimicrobiia bacterium]|jgi:hypothetical protein|nr:eukaryotic-like serine/threonine-protein kinase [Acidimicrobiia bacterium]
MMEVDTRRPRLELGDHVCAFYCGVAERDQVLLPFLQAGLLDDARCICVVHETTPTEVLEALGGSVDVAARLESQQLTVIPSTEAYLRGGYFSAAEMLEFYEDYVRTATEQGATARITGEGAFALGGAPGVEELMDYESELNRFVGQYPQIILCLYDLHLFGGRMMVDMLKTHPKLMLGGMLIENPHYLPPDEYRAARLSL